MKKTLLFVCVLTAGLWTSCAKRDLDGHPPLSAEVLLSLSSVVGDWRAPSPKWLPDASLIVFPSPLNGGGLVGISPEGGFPIRFPFDLGGTGRFFNPSVIEVSPDGKWIAFISAKSGSQEIWIWSLLENRETRLTDMKKPLRNYLSWAPDSRWIAFSASIEGNYDVHKVSIPGGEVVRLTRNKSDEWDPTWTPDAQAILYVRPDERGIDHDIMKTTAGGGPARLLVSDTDFFDEGGDTLGAPSVSPDGKQVLFRSWRSGWINYWVAGIDDAEIRQIAPEEADQSQGRWSPDGRYVAFCSNHNGTHDLRIVSIENDALRVLVSPDTGVCEDLEWSPDGTRISYAFSTLTKPKELFVITLAAGEIRQLTRSVPPGVEDRLVKAEKIAYPSSDGLVINAYLYKPGSIPPGEKFPGIIWIHGGPTGQYEDLFQHQVGSSAPSVQFIVQSGYVVLQPNIRGSSGYGHEFEKANNRCWGICDMKDVLAGVEYLKSLPYVDGSKMAITGRSYGGMLTMAAATNVHGVFQAMLVENGHDDWTKEYKMYDYELGPMPEHRELRWKLSPASHVEDVSTPVFVMHGEVEPPHDSTLFVTNLKKYDKEFIYKTYPGEGYSIYGFENRLQSLLDKLAFYDKLLKNKGEGVKE